MESEVGDWGQDPAPAMISVPFEKLAPAVSSPDPSHAMPPTGPVPWFPETPEAASVALSLCAALPDAAQPPLVQSSDDHALSLSNLGWVDAELGNIGYYKYTVILSQKNLQINWRKRIGLLSYHD